MKRLTPVWIFVLVFLAGAIYLPGFSKYLKLKNRESQLERDIGHLKTQISDLAREEELLKTDV